MSSVFRRTMEELMNVNMVQACLFIIGVGLTLLPQKALEPEGRCRAMVYVHYEAVITLSFFLVFLTYATCVMGHHVKTRVPDDAGLQSLSPRRARLMRSFAIVTWLLHLGATVLAVVTYTYMLQAKLGLFECLPTSTQLCVYALCFLLASIFGLSYIDSARIFLMEF